MTVTRLYELLEELRCDPSVRRVRWDCTRTDANDLTEVQLVVEIDPHLVEEALP